MARPEPAGPRKTFRVGVALHLRRHAMTRPDHERGQGMGLRRVGRRRHRSRLWGVISAYTPPRAGTRHSRRRRGRAALAARLGVS